MCDIFCLGHFAWPSRSPFAVCGLFAVGREGAREAGDGAVRTRRSKKKREGEREGGCREKRHEASCIVLDLNFLFCMFFFLRYISMYTSAVYFSFLFSNLLNLINLSNCVFLF